MNLLRAAKKARWVRPGMYLDPGPWSSRLSFDTGVQADVTWASTHLAWIKDVLVENKPDGRGRMVNSGFQIPAWRPQPALLINLAHAAETGNPTEGLVNVRMAEALRFKVPA